VTDGVLAIIDSRGVTAHTERILCQTPAERVKPILVLNMMNPAVLVDGSDKEAPFQTLKNIINKVDAIISTYHDDGLSDIHVYPEKGTVIFTSDLHGRSFALRQFATRYAQPFSINKDEIMVRLWGSHFFSPATGNCSARQIVDGQSLEQAFDKFLFDSVLKIFRAALKNEKDRI
jgi:elongation factor 2